MKRACQCCGVIAECETDVELSGLEICPDCMTSRDVEFSCLVCGLPCSREEAERSLAVCNQFGEEQAAGFRRAICANCTINEIFELLNARLDLVGKCCRCQRIAAREEVKEAQKFIMIRLSVDPLGDGFCSNCFVEGLATHLEPGGV